MTHPRDIGLCAPSVFGPGESFSSFWGLGPELVTAAKNFKDIYEHGLTRAWASDTTNQEDPVIWDAPNTKISVFCVSSETRRGAYKGLRKLIKRLEEDLFFIESITFADDDEGVYSINVYASSGAVA